jgi:iron complex transport system ATP-binding protein
VPQFSYKVIDFVTMGRAPNISLFSHPSEEDRQAAFEAIESLGIGGLAEKPYTEISGGERQQVMIARAIAQNPKVILFDEPTSHLDYGNQQIVLKLIRRLAHEGYGIIMTTHNPDHALLLGGNTAVLDDEGHLVSGNTKDIITAENLKKLYGTDVLVVRVDEAGRDACITPKL